MIERFRGENGKRLVRVALAEQVIFEKEGEAIEEIALRGELIEFKVGESIMSEGAFENDIYFIIAGEASVIKRDGSSILRPAGTHIGEMAAIDPSAARSATVVASEVSVVVKVKEADFSEVAQRFPFIWRALAKELGERLRQRAKGDHTTIPTKRLVLLIHGIRTEADWADMAKPILEDEDTKVVPIKYGFFDVFRFICPFFTRNRPIAEIHWKISRAIFEYPGAEITVIAHSFGTFAMSRILKENPAIKISKMILCGSIIKQNFKWGEFRNLPKIINDCGVRDNWPLLAGSGTWGFGCSGTFGFGSVEVHDRFNNYGHGGFFDEEFIRNLWVPFIKSGEIKDSKFLRPPVALWRSLLKVIQIRWLLVLGVIFVVALGGFWIKNFTEKKISEITKVKVTEVLYDVPGHMNSDVYAKYIEARKQFGLGNFPKSLQLFSDAIDLDQDNYMIYVNRSVVYLALNRSLEAKNDGLRAVNIYQNISDQQKKREKNVEIDLLNQLINIDVSAGNFKEAISRYKEKSGLVFDMTDSVMRVFNNVGNASYAVQDWNGAVDAYERTYSLAEALRVPEMQVISLSNLSNGYYWISGSEEKAYNSAIMAFELLDGIEFDDQKEAELRANAANALGLSILKCRKTGVKLVSGEDEREVYSGGINVIKEFSERSEVAYLALSNLYANRANCLREMGLNDEAIKDYRLACNRFINRQYKDGISRQLIGMFYIAKENNPDDHEVLYALVTLAQELGVTKPAEQRQEDQNLRSWIESRMTKVQKVKVEEDRPKFLSLGTGISRDTWLQF